MFARIIRDPASSKEEVFVYESLQIVFTNNVLVSQFHSWSLQSDGREGRSQQSSLAFKATVLL